MSGCLVLMSKESVIHTSNSYLPDRTVRSAVTGHLSAAPSDEKQYGAPSSVSISAASADSAASTLTCAPIGKNRCEHRLCNGDGLVAALHRSPNRHSRCPRSPPTCRSRRKPAHCWPSTGWAPTATSGRRCWSNWARKSRCYQPVPSLPPRAVQSHRAAACTARGPLRFEAPPAAC